MICENYHHSLITPVNVDFKRMKPSVTSFLWYRRYVEFQT